MSAHGSQRSGEDLTWVLRPPDVKFHDRYEARGQIEGTGLRILRPRIFAVGQSLDGKEPYTSRSQYLDGCGEDLGQSDRFIFLR